MSDLIRLHVEYDHDPAGAAEALLALLAMPAASRPTPDDESEDAAGEDRAA